VLLQFCNQKQTKSAQEITKSDLATLLTPVLAVDSVGPRAPRLRSLECKAVAKPYLEQGQNNTSYTFVAALAALIHHTRPIGAFQHSMRNH
jgi:hypothetical protein